MGAGGALGRRLGASHGAGALPCGLTPPSWLHHPPLGTCVRTDSWEEHGPGVDICLHHQRAEPRRCLCPGGPASPHRNHVRLLPPVRFCRDAETVQVPNVPLQVSARRVVHAGAVTCRRAVHTAEEERLT